MFIVLSFLVCIIGGVILWLADPTAHPKVCKLGEVMLWTGMLAFLINFRALPNF